MSENIENAKQELDGSVGCICSSRALYFQNKEIIEQNEKIIKLLTDIRGLS